MNHTLTDIPGLRIGHTTDLDAAAGCTVLLGRTGRPQASTCAGAGRECRGKSRCQPSLAPAFLPD